MASSSTMVAGSCFNCKSGAPELSNGWPLNRGGHAQLCNQCAEAYHNGTICSVLHTGTDGWRDCIKCGMDLHCGCIMSAHMYEECDFGGVICKNCLHKFDKTVSKDGFHCAIDLNADPNDLGSEEETLENNEEIKQASPDTNSVIIPLFKKVLTTSDTDLKLGRLLIPKTRALAYFPRIDEPKGFALKMWDETGGEWDFHYHYWQNPKSNIYVLDGLKDYMIANDWQAGDMVEFYRIEPEGKLVMFTRKLSVHLPPARPPPPPL